MLSPGTIRYAFNLTRQADVATRLLLADTHWSRFRGLMGALHEDFSAGEGLWIVPSRGVHTFGMRFAIDVAYLDSGTVVVHIEHRLRPWRIAPICWSASSVLEIPAGTLASTGTRIGDQIKIAQRRDNQDDPGQPVAVEGLAR
jgi:uncharacterized membrane protein (UPF0127 family)